MYDLIIREVNIVRPEGIFVGDVGVIGEIFAKIEGTIYDSGKVEIRGNGLYLLPGMIDCHVHLRTPGLIHKEDVFSGTQAAITSGVTSVLDMPNTAPPTIDRETLKNKRILFAKNAQCDFGFFLGATNGNLEEILRMEEARENFAGIKVFMCSSTGDICVSDDTVLSAFFHLTRKVIAVHAEDHLSLLLAGTRLKDIDNAARHGDFRPRQGVVAACEKAMALAVEWDHRIHICHVSTLEEVGIIEKKKGEASLTCEVSPVHLAFNESHYRKFGNYLKVNPPVRGEEDSAWLWKAVSSGVIDMIATDHAPHLSEEKWLPYKQAPSGAPGLDTALPFLLKSAVEGRITLETVSSLYAWKPALAFAIKNKGRIDEGFDADMAIVDLNESRKVEKGYLRTKCGWSLFEGEVLPVKPREVYLRGHLKSRRGELFDIETKGAELVFGEYA